MKPQSEGSGCTWMSNLHGRPFFYPQGIDYFLCMIIFAIPDCARQAVQTVKKRRSTRLEQNVNNLFCMWVTVHKHVIRRWICQQSNQRYTLYSNVKKWEN